MTRLKALFMVLVIALLAAALLHVPAAENPAAVDAIKPVSIIEGITPDQVHEISLIGTLGILKMRRTDDKQSWVLTEPEGALVDPGYSLLALESIFELQPENVIDPAEVNSNQSIYGLAPPSLVLRIKGDFGVRVLSFGSRNEISGGRYAQAEGDAAIYLIAEENFSILNKSQAEVRDRVTIKTKAEAITNIVAKGDNYPPFILNKHQASKQDVPRWFVISEGKQFYADGDIVREALGELVRTEAIEFVDSAGDKLPFYGLAKPLVTLRIDSEKTSVSNESVAEPIVTLFGKGLGKSETDQSGQELSAAYYQKLARDPWVYRIERKSIAAWLQGAQYFRDRAPFALIAEPDVQTLYIRSPEKEYRFSRKDADSEWSSAQKERGAKDFVSYDAVPGTFDDWLERMFSLRVLTYDEGASKQVTSQPFLEIRFTLFKSEANISSGRLIIGNQVPGSGLAERNLTSSPRYAILKLSYAKGDNSEEEVGAVLSGDIIDRLHLSPDFFTKGE